jgi:transcription-repair coupling factor (superfamily II helicase)
VFLEGLRTKAKEHPEIKQTLHRLARADQSSIYFPNSFSSTFLSLVDFPLTLVVTPTTAVAEDIIEELSSFVDRNSVALLPAWETLPHEQLSPSLEISGQRISTLLRIKRHDPNLRYVVAPIRALMQKVLTDVLDVSELVLEVGQEISFRELTTAIFERGYQKTDLVQSRGEFAIRGGIIDIFRATDPHPIRIEFWGDEIESIREFQVTDQMSTGTISGAVSIPATREILLTQSIEQTAQTLIASYPHLAELLTKISAGIYAQGFESLASLFNAPQTTLIELLPKQSAVVILQNERTRNRAEDLLSTSEEFLEAAWSNAIYGNRIPLEVKESSYSALDELKVLASKHIWIEHSQFIVDDDVKESVLGQIKPIAISTTENLHFDIQSKLKSKFTVLITAMGHGSIGRIREQLHDADIPSAEVKDGSELQSNVVNLMQAKLETGYEIPALKLLVLTEGDFFGERVSRNPQMPSKRRRTIDPLTLRPGDYVVHEHHGVGKYLRMEQRTFGSATKEFLVIEYAPAKRGAAADVLYVSTDQLDAISRYVGGEIPQLNRLGGNDWKTAKSKARKAVRQIASQLIQLYAARNATKGFAFSPDTLWQRELEDAFAYVETPDQLQVIDEVKRDMEKPIPMDRVVCGDVGYGKTEIAVRAAFKAIQDGKQVAVLVPTTLLVQQHTKTFAERYSPFPIKIGSLSRFQTDKENKQTLQGIEDGSIDLVIGTHRLLSKDVTFRNLGLVIVDEEQRFGVEHKEHLKAMRTNVDVLTLSATPIPRTLEMSLTGIREMSTIATPPESRHPILTYVGPYQANQVRASIRRELLREGQVFFIHNRVQSITQAAARISDLVPEARVAIAHGQMNEHELEKIIVDFWNKEYDVLVCTTIVESGLDIPNANTLIVERADLFGLSQLHQLRGRVGRGRERAYAYFLFPEDASLSDTAHDRLSSIAQFTDLGSGMQIAMKDLEIRGAGNLLGGEQSGHIAEVGFDLYVRLVGEALNEFKGETEESTEIRIELPITAYLPHDYVDSERLRMDIYQRLAQSTSSDDIQTIQTEIEDRFNDLPIEVAHLLDVANLRLFMRQRGVNEVVATGKHVRFAPVELPESMQLKIKRLYPGAILKISQQQVLLPLPSAQTPELLKWVRDTLQILSPEKVKA